MDGNTASKRGIKERKERERETDRKKSCRRKTDRFLRFLLRAVQTDRVK